MGRAHCIVDESLRQRLYDHGARHGMVVVNDSPWDNHGNRLVQVMSDALSPGYHGQQAIIADLDDGGFRFKTDDYAYES